MAPLEKRSASTNYYTMVGTMSLKNKLTENFIDYANENNINLIKWYRWQLHIMWEQRNIQRKLNPSNLKNKNKI